ncbi:MAG: phosphate transport system permease protein [Frankiales bacterium]|nr:phosphate transport system permease protein [Frankiales bacterium]MDX6212225.1 phosphate transport system permease protein [Frankiales bacterium]
MTAVTLSPGSQSALKLGASRRRRLVDQVIRSLAWLAFLVALTPLVIVLGYTISRGAKRFDVRFLTHSMAGVAPTDAGGGAYHAIVGTLEQVAITSVISVPLGLAAAVYLTEYGRGWLPRAIRFFVDVMTGVPSIVAGLFIYVFWVLGLHQGFSGFAGALALVILMLPVIIRSAEEMLLLVPTALREASYALGVPQWKTITRIVLPTASAGLVTGIMLAVARVIGETAPLLLTVFGTNYINTNPFNGTQSGLPMFIYNQAQQPYQTAIDRAWAGALTLILIVVFLYTAARLLTRRNRLAGRR